MKPDLTEEGTAALFAELDHIIENDRYPFSPRIRTLREIREKISLTGCASHCRQQDITSRREQQPARRRRAGR
jgi:hypothetical protein